jgi:hypothetical protein
MVPAFTSSPTQARFGAIDSFILFFFGHLSILCFSAVLIFFLLPDSLPLYLFSEYSLSFVSLALPIH